MEFGLRLAALSVQNKGQNVLIGAECYSSVGVMCEDAFLKQYTNYFLFPELILKCLPQHKPPFENI